ncbi:MAG: type II toxin-antitoxin system prevent-host-death family antitoxin [Gemmatimonadetes bacterium]|nr:MAG: type II toxin-antitoxin system prevent-host-death family antitoxin [Gemmatimonadota bacterium]PYP98473.1 MAG: type II toxin-antitoxin system prevent-host-death family antitoxin [Gemmatimonadota bacterium]
MKETKPHRVGIAAFKARLSAYLRGVRRGEAITLYDRNMPVARVVPVEPEGGAGGGGGGALRVREAMTRPRDVVLPRPLGRTIDSLEALLEERQGER